MRTERVFGLDVYIRHAHLTGKGRDFQPFLIPWPKELETQLFRPNVSSLQQGHGIAILSKFQGFKAKQVLQSCFNRVAISYRSVCTSMYVVVVLSVCYLKDVNISILTTCISFFVMELVDICNHSP